MESNKQAEKMAALVWKYVQHGLSFKEAMLEVIERFLPGAIGGRYKGRKR
jgi:hypothetical protein